MTDANGIEWVQVGSRRLASVDGWDVVVTWNGQSFEWQVSKSGWSEDTAEDAMAEALKALRGAP